MTAIATRNLKSSKGITITKGDTVELNYRERQNICYNYGHRK